MTVCSTGRPLSRTTRRADGYRVSRSDTDINVDRIRLAIDRSGPCVRPVGRAVRFDVALASRAARGYVLDLVDRFDDMIEIP